MKLKEFDILLDIKKHNKIEYIEVVQGDHETNIINITLIEGMNEYGLSGLNVEVVFAKSDGTTVMQDMNNGIELIGNKIVCTLKTNTIASPGKVLAEVRILDGPKLLTSSRFSFFVRKAIVNDETIESTNEFPLLQKLTNDVTGVIASEDSRVLNEDIRLVNEIDRATAENERVIAEDNRATTFAGYDARVTDVEDDLVAHKEECTSQRQQDQFKVATVEKGLNDYKSTMANVNVNQEAKQKVSGYGTISLPKNTANGQVSVSVKGLTYTNILGADGKGDNLSSWVGSAKKTNGEYFYVDVENTGSSGFGLTNFRYNNNSFYFASVVGKSSLDNVNAAIDTNVKDGNIRTIADFKNEKSPIRKGSKFSTGTVTDNSNIFPVNFPTNTLSFKEILVVQISQEEYNSLSVEELMKKYPYVNGTKSTVSASRLKSVGKNLWGIGHNSDRMFNLIAGNILDGAQITNYQNYIVGKIKVENKTYNWIRDEKTTYVASTKLPYILFTRNGCVIKYINLANANGSIILDGEYDVILGSYWDRQLVKGDYCNLKYLGIDNIYEPYTESTSYLPNVGELRSLPNGTKDEVRVSEGKLIKRIGEKTNVASGTVMNYADMATGGQFVAYASDGTSQVGVKGDTLTITATTLTYQLAEPIITPIEVSGTLLSNPSGTVYIENVVADAGIYTTKFDIKELQLPIKSIDKLIKYNFTTGVQTALDTSLAVINEDKKSFTHPNLAKDDMVFVDYYYDVEGTLGETTIEYYDSRHTIKDTTNNKFYSWEITSTNGVPTVALTEVL